MVVGVRVALIAFTFYSIHACACILINLHCVHMYVYKVKGIIEVCVSIYIGSNENHISHENLRTCSIQLVLLVECAFTYNELYVFLVNSMWHLDFCLNVHLVVFDYTIIGKYCWVQN